MGVCDRDEVRFSLVLVFSKGSPEDAFLWFRSMVHPPQSESFVVRERTDGACEPGKQQTNAAVKPPIKIWTREKYAELPCRSTGCDRRRQRKKKTKRNPKNFEAERRERGWRDSAANDSSKKETISRELKEPIRSNGRPVFSARHRVCRRSSFTMAL